MKIKHVKGKTLEPKRTTPSKIIGVFPKEGAIIEVSKEDGEYLLACGYGKVKAETAAEKKARLEQEKQDAADKVIKDANGEGSDEDADADKTDADDF